MKFKTIFFVTIFSLLFLNSLNGMGMLRNYAASLKHSIMNKVSTIYNQMLVKPQQFLAARKIKNVIISGKNDEIAALIQQNSFASLSVKDKEGIAQHILNNFNNFLIKPALFKIIPHIFTQDISKGFLKELFLKMIAHFDTIVTLNEGKSVFFNMMDVCDLRSLNHKEFLDFLHAILKNYHAIDQITKTRYFLDFKITVLQAAEIASLIYDPVIHWKKIIDNNGWLIIQNLLNLEIFSPLDAYKIRKYVEGPQYIEQPIETFKNLLSESNLQGILELFKRSSRSEINSFINILLEHHFSLPIIPFSIVTSLTLEIMKEYPDWGSAFTKKILDNLESYTSGCPNLVSIILQYTQDTTQFIPQIKRVFFESSLFSTDANTYSSGIKDFLNRFASQNKLFIQNLKQTLIEDFEKSPELIIQNSKSLNSIIGLMVLELNKSVLSAFNNTILEICLRKFDLFLKNEISLNFLKTIIDYIGIKKVSALSNIMQSHFLELIESPAGIDVIINIIELFRAASQPPDAIINLIIKHSDIIREKKAYIIFEEVLKVAYVYGFDELKLKPLISLIENNFLEFCINSEKSLEILINTNESSWLIPKVSAHINELSLEFLGNIAHLLPWEAQRLVIAKSIKILTGLKFDDKTAVSQTEIYFKNIFAKNNYIFLKRYHNFSTNTQLQTLCSAVIEKERNFGEDYYTFVHGQRREYYWPERLFTFLYSLKKRQAIPHFFFAHVKDLIETEDDRSHEKVHKNFLLNNHQFNYEARSLVLFMNYALFANTTDLGSNSLSYIIINSNASKGTSDILAIDSFRKLGYTHIYSEFEKEIEALAQEYNESGQYGNLLFIAIPKEDIHKYVYLAVSGATKVGLNIEGIGKTYDIRIIMDNLLNHSEKIKDIDKLEFCLIMTQQDGGLDPSCGIHIYPILTGDPEKLAELKKKEEALFAKIERAVKQEQQQTMQAIALRRANILVGQMTAIK